MYEKPIILSSQDEKDPKYVCGGVGCSCTPSMSSEEKHCHFIGAWYCWCDEY